ncbi:MAG TPA: hypothetical protein VD906_16370 [Caulobacteraceae bacterium]|nr:hypothetical protein [Caulobacteraceae bacterium]
MTHHRAALLIALLCLAACDEPPPRSAPAPAVSTAAAVAGAAVTDPKTVPPAFRALWAVSDCDGEVMEIAANTLSVGEGRAAVASVVATGPNEIRIAVTLPSGGLRSFRYRLIDDGAALFDVRSGLTRRRCPAA